MEIVSIYPEKELKKKLETEAKKESRSLNQQILHILRGFFRK